MSYSTQVETVLRRAGWSPTRLVSTVLWAETLAHEGYTPFSSALAILEHLGGLYIDLPPNPYPHVLVTDPVRAGTGEFDRVEEWQRELGVRLFPLGEVETCGNPVWLADSGQVFYGKGFGLYFLGDSVGEALERLITARIDPNPVIP